MEMYILEWGHYDTIIQISVFAKTLNDNIDKDFVL